MVDFEGTPQNLTRKMHEIEFNIERRAENILDSCVQISHLEQMGYSVSHEPPSIDTEVFNDYIIFYTNFPINVTKGDSRHNFYDFGELTLPVRLGHMYDVAEFITDFTMDNPELIPLNRLDFVADLGLAYHINIDEDNNAVVYYLRDYSDDSSYYGDRYYKGGHFQYVFAHKFD